MRSRGEAYDYVECWLRPLFIPIAHFALEQVRSSASIIQNKWAGDSEYIAGATGCLNSWAMKTTGGDMPTYIHSRAGARWKAECRVVDEDGAEHMSEAVRDTKQSAKQYAAYMLCRELGLDIGEK
jgi:ribonuclease-3